MDLQRIDEVNQQRRAIRHLLSPHDPADALTSYYALWHDPRRTQLTLHHNAKGRVDGFLTLSQTGADLFRPLVTLRAPNQSSVSTLVRSALVSERSYLMVVPVTLAPAVRQHLDVARSTLNHIYRLDPARFQPIVNVLVQQVSAADGTSRFQIESQGQVVAMSGTNWRSPTFAEVFVYVQPKGRGRGWGKSVVSACTAALLEDRLLPLYMMEESNESSVRIAEGLGYVDTGAREFAGEGQLK